MTQSPPSRLLREPLLHFVLLGAALFALDAWTSGGDSIERDDQVVITAGQIESIGAMFARTRQRPPTLDELKGLVDAQVLEEILYREGVALGLDRDDTIIRRRLRQKMDFIVDDVADLTDPTEDELKAWLDAHPADFARAGRVSFIQVYLDPERRGEALDVEAAELLTILRDDPRAWESPDVGDPTMIAAAHGDVALDVVHRTFGGELAAELDDLELGVWSGPIRSSFGAHLVRVDERVPGEAPALEDVRDAVEREWRYARRADAARRYHDELLERYDVRIEWPRIDENEDGAR